MENELIKIETREGFGRCVSLRELHEGLKIKSKFNDFAKRMCGYGFEENIDYIKVTQKKVTLNNEEKNRAYNEEDYIITIDMAKEICMLQRSDIGREFRKYFIECEKQLKEVVKITKEDELILNVVKAKDVGTRMIALSEYGEYKENRIREQEVKPLQEEVKKLSPLAQTLIKRFEKGENITFTDVTKTFNLKRGQVSRWAIKQGLIYKNKKDVTNKGDIYFQRYVINGLKNICITPQGVQLIEQHLDEVKIYNYWGYCPLHAIYAHITLSKLYSP